MNVARSVSATFNKAPKARIGTTGYDSVYLAYAAASSTAGVATTIMLLDGELLESLNANLGKSIVFKGGYNQDYSGRSGMPTVMKGTLRIRSGKLTVDRLSIKMP
ncbi:MAG: hypothetical protein A2075_00810 [Geobacteraceae bacterium GWC2_58_44]|nr:MAG: hypothetical protein A2075_00810 [Geobacteraceae bacterium GWC2_58_44]